MPMVYSSSVKYIIGILKGIALNLQIVLCSMGILMMLILPVCEYGICFHLFVSSLISFFRVLQYSQYRSFTSLVKFIPRYFIFPIAIVNGIFSQFLFIFFIVVLLQQSQFSQHHLLKRLFYSIVCSCSLCQILIDQRDMDLFLGSLFCSIDLYVCSYACTRLF